MDNNKNRVKDRPKSNAELRKMFPKDGEDIGYKNGENLNTNGERMTTRSKMSHNEA